MQTVSCSIDKVTAMINITNTNLFSKYIDTNPYIKEVSRSFSKGDFDTNIYCIDGTFIQLISRKKVVSLNSKLPMELKQIEKQIEKLNNQFVSLLTLHAEGAINTEQFKHQNERIAHQLQELANKKAEIQSGLETRKDITEQLQAFKKEVERFANLDIDDEQVLKQVLQRLINKIEVYEEGKIKIHYNLSPSLSS
jgi:selenocysteine-specific translation elongation factor